MTEIKYDLDQLADQGFAACYELSAGGMPSSFFLKKPYLIQLFLFCHHWIFFEVENVLFRVRQNL